MKASAGKLPERPILVAPGAFKGTFRASQVAAAIGRGLERAGLMAPDLCPVADGSEGTTDVLIPVLGGEIVAGPSGTSGGFALLEDGDTALVEDTGEAETSHGTGELVSAALDAGAAVILIAGVRPAVADGGAAALKHLAEHAGPGRAKLVLLCPRPLPANVPWAGCAVLEPGVRWVLEALDFDVRMRAARAVVAGEGTLDFDTLGGRLVGEIGQRTRQSGVPLHAIVGRARLDGFGRRMIDLQRVLEAGTLEEVGVAGEQLGRELADGRA